MRSFFSDRDRQSATQETSSSDRVSRHSSGWALTRSLMNSRESLRVLDIGPTSPTNISYVTGLGHSIYMTNLVQEAAKPEWLLPSEKGEPDSFDVDRFITTNLAFAGREFDVVLFWDTADYLPQPLLAPVLNHIQQVMVQDGQLLAFFHIKDSGSETAFCRYHLTDGDTVQMQRAGKYPLLQVYNNRQIEGLFSSFSSYRFFLAKDNLREVIVAR
jgi:hypothetical protein